MTKPKNQKEMSEHASGLEPVEKSRYCESNNQNKEVTVNQRRSLEEIRVRFDSLAAVLWIAVFFFMQSLTAQPAQAQQEEAHKIQWHDHTFYTNRPLPRISAALRMDAYPDTVAEGFYFVQFTGPITADMKERVQSAGGELMNYVPNNTYIVRMSESERAAVEALPIIQYVGVYQPVMKLSRRLISMVEGLVLDTVTRPEKPPYRLKLQQFIRDGDTTLIPVDSARIVEPETLSLTVSVFRGENLSAMRQQVAAVGGTILQLKEGKRRSKLLVSIPRRNIRALSRINGIRRIEEFRIPKLRNDTSRDIVNVTPAWGAHGLRLKGRGQKIGICDTGIDSGKNDASMHDDFEGRIINIHSWPVQPYADVQNDGDDDGKADLESGHGTHVAGSALGNGTMSGETYAGSAPEAEFVFQAIEQWTEFTDGSEGYAISGIPSDLNGLFQQAYDDGVRIHSNSWGVDDGGAYGTTSHDLDEFIWEHPDLLVVVAAGNAGEDTDGDNVMEPSSVGSPSTAKNCLCVGGSENNRPSISIAYEHFFDPVFGPVRSPDWMADSPGGLVAFSSRGPTQDGRIKPDVVAPGTFIVSTRTQATPNTTYRADNMESGVGLWTADAPWAQVTTGAHSGVTSWHDSPSGNYGDDVSAALKWNTMDLTPGDKNKLLTFWFKSDLGTGDHLDLEIHLPILGGYVPLPLTDFFGPSVTAWHYVTVGLSGMWDLDETSPGDFAEVEFVFRLTSNGDGSTGDGVYIDDVFVIDVNAAGWGLVAEHGFADPGSVVDQYYMTMGGTSMATPLTTGAAAIVRQYYTDVVGLDYVSAALLRATLMNGARDLSPGQYASAGISEMAARPDNNQGWGRVDLMNSIFPSPPAVIEHVDQLAGLSTGNNETYSLKIIESSVPITVTMVYHDYPGAGLVNDLDLSVLSPDGLTTYYPNKLGGPDNTNNVEQIVVGSPVAGTYTITVHGTSVPEGPQPYALVTSAGGTIEERPPVDIMLVLDISGSMQSSACPSGCDSKLDVLKDAVEIFTAVWEVITESDDRMGVTYFRTDVSEFTVGSDVLVPVVGNTSEIIADVQSQTTNWSNMTAMGAGIQNGVNLLDETEPTRPKNIILFTDGMQNVNPMVRKIDDSPPPDAFHLVIDNDPTRSTSSNIPPTSPPTVLGGGLDVRISTIAVGATDPYLERLDEIAGQTDGLRWFTTAPDDDLRRFFVEDLVDVLKEHSPQLLAYRYGTLGNSPANEEFLVNANVRKIVFKVSWKRGDRMSFRVFKDTTEVTELGTWVSGQFYGIFALELPFSGGGKDIVAAGNWRVQISGRPAAGYEIAAITEEPLLEYEMALGDRDYRVGDPIELSVRLTYGGHPVVDASKVTALVLKPKLGIGTLMSVNRMPSAPASFQIESSATASQKKFELLLMDGAKWQSIQPTGQTVTLANNGDGSYSAAYTNTNVPGNYTVVFDIEGQRSDIGEYRRTESMSTLIQFGAAVLDKSKLLATELAKTADIRNLELYVRPRDRFDNYLGPDYGDQIWVGISDGSVSGDTRDGIDGSYTVPLRVPVGADPVITVSVLGRSLYEGPLSGIIVGDRRWSASLHAGAAAPAGTFANDYDPSYSVAIDFDYHFTPQLSAVFLVGYNHFKSGAPLVDDTYWLNVSANLKYELPLFPIRPYINGGPGIYIPETGSRKFGFNAGLGRDVTLTPNWTAEFGADYHHIFMNGGEIQFVVGHAGLIFRF